MTRIARPLPESGPIRLPGPTRFFLYSLSSTHALVDEFLDSGEYNAWCSFYLKKLISYRTSSPARMYTTPGSILVVALAQELATHLDDAEMLQADLLRFTQVAGH